MGKSFTRRGGDEAQRAFGADQEVLEVVAGIVLFERVQPLVEPAIGQHGLDPERQFAGVAEGQHLDAAGVGAQHAADAGGALRGDPEREHGARRFCRLMRVLEDDAGFERHVPGGGIDRRARG